MKVVEWWNNGGRAGVEEVEKCREGGSLQGLVRLLVRHESGRKDGVGGTLEKWKGWGS